MLALSASEGWIALSRFHLLKSKLDQRTSGEVGSLTSSYFFLAYPAKGASVTPASALKTRTELAIVELNAAKSP